jgi:integrase
MKKIPTGMGTITKLSGKRDKKYWARLPAYYDEKGKRHRPSAGTYKTYGEAYQALKRGQSRDKINTTLYQCYKKYTEGKKYEKLSQNTKEEYDRNVLKFKPLIYKPIKLITYQDLQDKMDELIEDGYEVQKGGETITKQYKPSTLRKINAAITAAYDVAINDGILEVNYGHRLTRITKEKAYKFPSLDLEFVDELKKKLDNNSILDYNLRHDVMRLLVNIYTGLRPGEMVKLKKENINFEGGYIEGVGIKTEAGRARKVPILPTIKPYLEELLSISDYVLGKKYSTGKYRDTFFYPLMEKLNYKKPYVVYSCRHTFADILSIHKIDKEVIKQIMGHTSYSTTSDFYISENIDFSIEEIKTKIMG